MFGLCTERLNRVSAFGTASLHVGTEPRMSALVFAPGNGLKKLTPGLARFLKSQGGHFPFSLSKLCRYRKMARRLEWVASVLGHHVDIYISEPDSLGGGPLRPVALSGRLRRVLRLVSASGKDYTIGVVELESPLEWPGRRTGLVSIISRGSNRDLTMEKENVSFPVNVAAEDDWLLVCREDDPRLSSGRNSIWLGYGGARIH